MKANNGNTLVELIMVMLLLILFGVTISSLIYSGGETQQKIISEKNAQINARVAVSYLNMRIRQSDAADKIVVEKNDVTGDNSILIRERAYWGGYDTWIFWADGYIYECISDEGGQPSVELSERIIAADWFHTDINADGSIYNSIGYTVNGVQKELHSSVYLRSGVGQAEGS